MDNLNCWILDFLNSNAKKWRKNNMIISGNYIFWQRGTLVVFHNSKIYIAIANNIHIARNEEQIL